MNKDKLFIYRHGPSNGAKLLARALGIKMIKAEGSKFTPSTDKVIINWGRGQELPIDTTGVQIVNQPEAVVNATNKLKCFKALRNAGNVSIPPFTTRRTEAEDWLRRGSVCFARTRLQGSSGDGIVELETADDLGTVEEGTLIVEYIKKKHEFRIHVGDGEIIDRQQKKKRRDVDLEDINWRVRSHANGFVFVRQEVQVPKCVDEEALKAMEVIGLDFGAVDVIYNQHQKKAYVLEINTAPGIEGSTVLVYRDYFRRKLNLGLPDMDVFDVVELARQHGIELER